MIIDIFSSLSNWNASDVDESYETKEKAQPEVAVISFFVGKRAAQCAEDDTTDDVADGKDHANPSFQIIFHVRNTQQ